MMTGIEPTGQNDRTAAPLPDRQGSETANDLAIISAHAQLLQRRVRRGQPVTDANVLAQMDVILAAVHRLRRHLPPHPPPPESPSSAP